MIKIINEDSNSLNNTESRVANCIVSIYLEEDYEYDQIIYRRSKKFPEGRTRSIKDEIAFIQENADEIYKRTFIDINTLSKSSLQKIARECIEGINEIRNEIKNSSANNWGTDQSNP